MSLRSLLIVATIADLVLCFATDWQIFKFGFIALLFATIYVHTRWYS